MKKTVATLLLVLAVGCGTKNVEKIETLHYEKLDTIIAQSESNLTVVATASRQGDSAIAKKVTNAVNKIQSLEAEVKELKEENSQLKEELGEAKSAGKPYKLLPSKNY